MSPVNYNLSTLQTNDQSRNPVKPSKNIQDLLIEGKLEARDHLYDFEIVSFLKRNYDMSFQQATNLIKQMKGKLKQDQAYISRHDFVYFLSTNSVNNQQSNFIDKPSISYSSNTKAELSSTQKYLQSQNNSNLLYQKKTPTLKDLKQQTSSVQQLLKKQTGVPTKIISTQFLREQDDSRQSFSRHIGPLSPSSRNNDSRCMLSQNSSNRNSMQKKSNVYIQPNSPQNNSITSNKLFSPSNIISNPISKGSAALINKRKNFVFKEQQPKHQSYSKYLSKPDNQGCAIEMQRNSYLMPSKTLSQSQNNQYSQQQQIDSPKNQRVQQYIMRNTFTDNKQQLQLPSQLLINQLMLGTVNHEEKASSINQISYGSRNLNIHHNQFMSPQTRVGQMLTSSDSDPTIYQRNATDSLQSQELATFKTYELESNEGQPSFKRKLSYSHLSQVHISTPLKQDDDHNHHNEDSQRPSLESQQQEESPSKYKSVVYQTNTKSRSNSFIRGSPTRFLQKTKDEMLGDSSSAVFNVENVKSINDAPVKEKIADKFKDYLEELKKKCQDMNEQFDKRHSELFQQDEPGEHRQKTDDEEECQAEEKMTYYDQLFGQKLKESKYTNWHLSNDKPANVVSDQSLEEHQWKSDNTQQKSILRLSQEHFYQTNNGGISPIEQSRIIPDQSSPMTQSNQRIIQRMREIQEEFEVNKSVQKSNSQQAINSFQAKAREYNQLSTTKLEQDIQQFDIRKQEAKINLHHKDYVIQEKTVDVNDTSQEESKDEHSPQFLKRPIHKHAEEVKNEVITQPLTSDQPSKKQILNQKLNNIRARLKQQDYQQQVQEQPRTDDHSNQEISQENISYNQESQINRTNIDEEEEENEMMHRTFAMDVNESFGTVGNRKRNSRLKRYQENQDLDYDSSNSPYSSIQKRNEAEASNNDPNEILRSLREGVQKAILESKIKNIPSDNQRFTDQLSSPPKRRLIPTEVELHQPQIKSVKSKQQYIEEEKRKLQLISQEFELRQRELQAFQDQHEDEEQ